MNSITFELLSDLNQNLRRYCGSSFGLRPTTGPPLCGIASEVTGRQKLMLTDCNCVLALTVTDCQLSRNTQHYNSLHRCQRRCWLDRRSTANHTVVGGDLNAHNTYYVGRRTHCVFKVMGSKVKVAETFAGEAYRSTVGRQRPSCFVTLCQITEKVIDYELRPFCTLCWYFDLIAFV